MRGLSDKLFLSPILSTKALTNSRYFVQDWNQDNWFPVTAGSFHLNFLSRGTSDPLDLCQILQNYEELLPKW